jgi:hypothetical protein
MVVNAFQLIRRQKLYTVETWWYLNHVDSLAIGETGMADQHQFLANSAILFHSENYQF